MAGSINSGYNVNAASVPVSKYIANATHTGALQDQGSKVTKTEAPPEKQKPIVDAAPTPPDRKSVV